jgi:CPA1 family monovalent cation:H+ antiporter
MDGGLTSQSVTTLVWLLATVILVAVASKYIRIPYTIALTIVGLIIALSGIKLQIDVTPDLILFIFLPALLFDSAYNLPFGEVRDNLRPIVLLAVPGVILTAVCVAAGLYFSAGVSWSVAFLFGAIMSATDPVSVLAVFRKIGAPQRLAVILEGESLFNDGTAIVLFRIVLGIIIAGTVENPAVSVGQFLLVVLGATALGAAVGFLVSMLLSRVNDYLVETAVTLVVAYGTYLLAEQLGVSGVIAVVVAAMVLGNYGRATAMSPSTRLVVSSNWEFLGFLANSFIFLLIGLELDTAKLSRYWLPTLGAIAIVMVVRALVVVVASAVLRYIHRPIPRRWQAVLVWGGLRGSLALALALSLPITSQLSLSADNRDLVLVMTFGVILFSLLVQGLTMEPLLKRLGVIDRRERQDEYETIAARKAMATAALNEIDKMSKSGGLSAAGATDLRTRYNTHIETLDESLRELRLQDEDLRQAQEKSIRRHLLQVEKNAVQQRNLDGAISDEPMRRLLAELDEELHTLDEEGGQT